MEPDIDPDWGQKAFEHFFEVWIKPEVERRLQAGLLPSPFVLRGAQIIFNMDGSEPQVRLNNEVKGVLFAKPAKEPFKPGQAVMASDVGDIRTIELTDLDPNAAHVTVLMLNDKTYCVFNFKYNATRVSEVLAAADEFLTGGSSALERGHLRAFVENLWSAVELLAKGYLLWMPDKNLLTSKRHGYTQSRFNIQGKSGNVESRWVQLLNNLTELREPARYLKGELRLTLQTAGQMLKDAQDLSQYVREHNPPRHKR